MNDLQIFDKVKWHTAKNIPFEKVKIYFKTIMDFLSERGLLSDDGKDIYEETGITADFVIESDMLNETGISFMINNYSEWLLSVGDYRTDLTNQLLHQMFNQTNSEI